jgi:HAD superfamily hydrolase (TIGR01549 family)
MGGPLPKKSLPALSGRSIRCILFDLGDTLWSRKDMAVWQRMEEDAHVRAAMRMRQCVASPFLSGRSEVELGKRLRESVEEKLRIMIRREPDLEPDGGLAVTQTLADWGVYGVERSTGAAIFEDLRVRIPGSRPLFDDVHPTLKTLQERGFQLGIVTNRHWGGELFQQDLRTLGLLQYFDPHHMAISVDLGVRKPNPAIFLHTLNALNIPPAEAAMVGDSLLSDIVGSQALGILSIWKPKPSVLAQAQLTVAGAAREGQAQQTFAPSSEAVSAGSPADLPPGMHITDDDYVLAHLQSRAGKWDEHLHSEVKPDLIIENLSDLRDIFLEVGT